MDKCPPLSREMLREPVDLRVPEAGLDFAQARKIADRRARELCPAPILLAWFDRGAARYSPNAPCCREDKPSWLVYAESRGGDLILNLNDGEFVFIYLRG